MPLENSTAGQLASNEDRLPFPGLSTLIVARMSFGGAATYLVAGHLPVFSDLDSQFDLTLDPLAPIAIGAAVATNAPASVRLELEGNRNATGFLVVRAKIDDVVVVHPATVEMFAGMSSIDLPVEPHLPPLVGTLNRDWVWEIQTTPGRFEPLIAATGESVWPTRTYLTAGVPSRTDLLESYYHIACATESPATTEAAEQAVWRTFSSGRPIHNVRGRALSFWQDQIPGVANDEFIRRMAIDLVCIGDASCRAWAELFHLCLAVHGIKSDVKAVRPKMSVVLPRLGLPSFLVPDGRGGKQVHRTIGLMVHGFRWGMPSDKLTLENDRQAVNAFKFQWKLNNTADHSARDWIAPSVVDVGRRSHGNESAPGLFGNHAVVRTVPDGTVRDGITRWYDPSFGIGPHTTVTAYEDQLLGRGSENPGGVFAIIGWQKSADGTASDGLLLGAHPPLPVPMLEVVDVG